MLVWLRDWADVAWRRRASWAQRGSRPRSSFCPGRPPRGPWAGPTGGELLRAHGGRTPRRRLGRLPSETVWERGPGSRHLKTLFCKKRPAESQERRPRAPDQSAPSRDSRVRTRLRVRLGPAAPPACPLQWSASLLLPSSVGTFARALDCSSSVRQPSLHMSAAAASRDITLVSERATGQPRPCASAQVSTRPPGTALPGGHSAGLSGPLCGDPVSCW